MDKTRRMHQRQSIQQGKQQPEQILFSLDTAEFEHIFQTLPPLVLHHHVGCVIRFENTENTHDIGVAKTGKRLRFGQESIQAPPVGI